ncbi:hypothetical protein XMA121_000133 [Marinobacterium sp. xm-a-121]|uniref:hypothetical protein n=1 Tax=unclassified Marinobacterium TaxID=2644139 RepID=UPI001568427A|nr:MULTISPECIES: hypothetical protein [unclassified Marinobacterium]NRP37548.1 hypothetical protein [Marinobacterium sp. xm-a-121]NRP99892.1 hypothetical protein [Marinobacterium sp. xm-v-233]
MNGLASVSRSGISVVVFFLLFVFLFRALVPVGDEPDWNVRTNELLDEKYPLWFPYNWTFAVSGFFDTDSRGCEINASPMSFWGSISESCFDGFEQVAKRSLITIFVVSPFLLLLIFRGFFAPLLLSMNKAMSRYEYQLRLNSLGNCLVFPGVIYYLGLLSVEQFFLAASFAVFLLWGNFLIVGFLLWMLFAIDFGNAMVVTVFVLLVLGLQFSIRRIGLSLTFFVATGILSVVYFVGFRLLTVFFDDPNAVLAGTVVAGKAEAIYEAMALGGYREKYPAILRPIISFMSGVFMTPTGLKSIFAYIVAVIGLYALFLRTLKRLGGIDEECRAKLGSFLTAPLLLILFFTFLIPTYANAKYYIFALPFLMYVAVSVFGSRSVFMFNIALSLSVALNIGFFWIS